MKKTALIFALAAACFGSAASAQSYGYHGDRYERPVAYGYGYDDRYENRYDDRYDSRRYDRYEHRDYRDDRQRRHQRDHRRIRGAGPQHDIFPGERLPQAYWGERNIVHNEARYGLPPPAYGHRWFRVGRDFVSSSRHTGIVGAIMVRRR